MAYWSVAQTQPFSEKKAQRFLESQCFDCYLPKFLESCILKNRQTTRDVVLFARYLFVRVVDSWHQINATPGVSRLLVDERMHPIIVRDKVLADLRAREDHHGFVVLPKKEKYRIGQQVRVLSGQFAGRLALYDGMSTRQRERILLELLGQTVPVELNIGSRLEAASAA